MDDRQPHLVATDPRIAVFNTDRRRTAPPCSVRIWKVAIFNVWVGTCECNCWSQRAASGNAFGWFQTQAQIQEAATAHLRSMDEARTT